MEDGKRPCFLSVVTVVKNDIQGLKRTYESVQQQTSRGFEWIVVDGASTDGGTRFLESLAVHWLRWISEPDSGIYDAMNKAVKICDGEYTLFLNAGDTFSNNNVIEAVRFEITGAREKLDAIFCGACLVFPRHRIYRPPRNIEKYIWNGLPAVHQSTIYRSEIVREHPYDLKYKICSDYWLAANLSKIGLNFLYMNIPFCDFRVGGYSSRNFLELIKESTLIQHRVLRLPWYWLLLSVVRRSLTAIIFLILMRARSVPRRG